MDQKTFESVNNKKEEVEEIKEAVEAAPADTKVVLDESGDAVVVADKPAAPELAVNAAGDVVAVDAPVKPAAPEVIVGKGA